MRNLKKVLALALVTVMLLGMMAMASAKGFADEDLVDAKYDVAVDVMQAIGVFEGSNGYLYPQSTLTRAEAAKVITYIAMTKANASKLGTAEAPFADVAADHWAAASVAYAKQMGIIGGVGNDNYDPNGSLTGYAFAKMLLVVLGYKAENQGYVGSNWSVNVNADALKAGLLKTLDGVDLAANITREQAAQMAFNALNAYTASYAGNTSITIGDVVLAVGGSVQISTTETLAKKLYPTLTSNANYDKYGYEVKEWKYGTPAKVVATGITAKTLLADAAAAKQKDVYAAIAATAAGSMNIYQNGDDTVVGVYAYSKTGAGAANANLTGMKVDVVKDTDGTIKALATYAFPAQVTKVTAATDTAKRNVTIKILDASPAVTFQYETEAYAVNDYVMVYPAADAAAAASWVEADYEATDAILKIEAAETVYGTLTQVDKKTTDGSVTKVYLDGTAYTLADASIYADAVSTYTLNYKRTVILANGAAVACIADVVAPSATNVVFVNGDYTVNDAYGVATKYYHVVYMDGTVASLKAVTGNEPASAGQFYKVTAGTGDDAGKYSFSTTMPTGFAAETVAADTAITAKTKALDFVSTDKAYFTADTKVVFVSGANATLKVEVVDVFNTTLPAAKTDVLTVYNETAKADEIVAIFVNQAKSTDVASTADLYYVVDAEVSTKVIDGKTYSVYAAYEIATGTKVNAAVATTSTHAGFSKLKAVDANGVYTFVAATEPVTKYTVAADTITTYGNFVSVTAPANSFEDYDASATVVIDASDNTTKLATIAKLAAATGEKFYAVVNTTTLGAEKVVAFVVVD